MDECDAAYKVFWSKEGPQKPFRTAMRNLKKKAADVEKDHGKWEKAKEGASATKKTATKSLVAKDFEDELPFVGEALKNDVKAGRIANMGVQGDPQIFASQRKAVHLDVSPNIDKTQARSPNLQFTII